MHLLIAPVEAYGDVTLDLANLILGQVAREHLPPEIDQLVHNVTQFIEEVHFILLWWEKKGKYGGNMGDNS